jgi:histone-lysine N-methyltransferase SETMAR
MSARKLMETVFWDRKGVLMVEFMQQGTTRTSQIYCETLTKLHRAGHTEQRRAMLTSGLVLLHDNVLPHTAARTGTLLESFNWELFDHPPYSPDLVLSDYYLFTYLKNWMQSQRPNNNEELMEGTKTWLSSQAADFFGTGLQKLIPRYDTCLNSAEVAQICAYFVI